MGDLVGAIVTALYAVVVMYICIAISDYFNDQQGVPRNPTNKENKMNMKHRIRRLRRFVRLGWWQHVVIPRIKRIGE